MSIFDQRFTRTVQEKALKAIQAAFAADPLLKNISATYGGGSIGPQRNDATLKFAFLDTTAKPSAAFGLALTDDTVRQGLAGVGVEIIFQGTRYKIIKARQVKYLATSTEDGKNYTLPFKGCTLAHGPAPVKV